MLRKLILSHLGSPSRITTRNRSIQGRPARGKLASSGRGRGAPSAFPNTAPAEESDAPRAKRARKTSPIQETPRPTRQSARLLSRTRANSSSSPEAPNQETANNLTTTTRTRNRSGAITRSRNTAPADVKTEPLPRLKITLFTKASNPSATADRHNVSHKTENTARGNDNSEDNPLIRSSNKKKPSNATTGLHSGSRASNDKALKQQGRAERVPMTSKDGTGLESKKTLTTSGTKKRKKANIEDENTDNLLSVPVHSNKKLKLEPNAHAKASKPQLQNGTGNDRPIKSPGPETTAAVESGQPTTEAKTSNDQLSVVPAASRGRGTGRGRGRGRRRGRGGGFVRGGGWRGGKSRGRGGGGRGGGRGGARGGKRTEDDSDIARSPSPCPATQKLRERQKELDKAFKKVAAAQQLALTVMADHTHKRLSKNKNAHLSVLEHTQIQKDLDTCLHERQDILRHEYDLKVKQANMLFEANKDLLENQFRVRNYPLFIVIFCSFHG